MILDTTFIIDLFKEVPEAVRLAGKLEDESVKVTATTVFEVYQGRYSPTMMKRADDFFSSAIVLDFTKVAAKRAGTLLSSLNSKGTPIDPGDCMIAAVAILENEPVVTRNAKHFSRIPGLKVITY